MTTKARLRVGPGAVVVLLLAALAVAVLVSALTNRPGTAEVSLATSAPVTTGIFVHVLGAVVEPGLYQLREGDRVVDAVAAAGGYAADADQSQQNLARLLVDGEQLLVPVVGAAAPADGGSGLVGGKVNVNTADQATLETLPRVGPAMAQLIIEWRETNGRFATVEDLMSVTGIGEKTFEGLRELVTV